ncbi:TerD family protein [Peribacillus deserti]|nr:TerD family protein [Peribacillus deserti]
MKLLKGQKVDITKARAISDIVVTLDYSSGKKDMEIDGAAFLLEENGKCKGDEGFVFYGQPATADCSVRHTLNKRQNEIHIQLKTAPTHVQKIAFTLTIHEGEQRGHFFNQVTSSKMFIKDKRTGEIMYEFPFGEGLSRETAIVVGELYRHNGEWKLNAIGSGFFGGLAALCQNFGIEVKQEPAAPEIPPQTGIQGCYGPFFVANKWLLRLPYLFHVSLAGRLGKDK